MFEVELKMNYRLPYLLYFLSGATALVYEVVWARKLGLVFGADAYGVGAVLAVFFLGLAMGSFLAGKWRFETHKALKNYGLLEIGVGLYALFTPFIFKHFLQIVAGNLLLSPIMILILSLIVLIVPATLIGATFPTIIKVIAGTKVGKKTGLLYGLNTLGAVVGAMLAGFWLVYFLGMDKTIWLTAAVNLIVGFMATQINVNNPESELSDKAKNFMPNLDKRLKTVMLVAFFLAGFSALALEVLWTRVLVLAFGSSTFAFTLILVVFLFGIAAGSLIASRFVKVGRNIEKWFAISFLATGIVVIGLTPLLGGLPKIVASFLNPADPSFLQNIWATFILSFLALIVPTTLMGVNFVIGIRICTQSYFNASKNIGNLYAINTLGGVLGSLLSSFWLLPYVGVQKAIIVSASFYFVVAIIISVFMLKKTGLFSWGVAAVSLAFLVAGFVLPTWNKHLLTSGSYVYFRDYLQEKDKFDQAVSRGDILYYKEGLLATLVVKKAPEGFIFLRTNGKADASTDQDLDDLHLIGHLPLILHPNAQKVLSIGLGSGITLGSVAQHDSVKNIEVVEIEPAMVGAASKFADYNHNVLSDPRLKITIADARSYITNSKTKYDVITSQPSNLWVRGNANLFTKEFFEDSKASLNDDGLMLQWVPFYSYSESDFKTTLATFASAFPYVTVWSPGESHDVLLVGSKIPQQFDFEKVSQRIKSEKVQADLDSAAINNGENLLGHYLFDQESLKKMVGKTDINTDDRPILEYSSAFSLYKDTVAGNIELLGKYKGDPRQHFINLGSLDNQALENTQKAIDLIFKAKIESSSGKLENAAKDFEESLKILPKTQEKKELSRVYFELARKSYEAKDLVKTTTYFEKSVEFYPNAQVYLNLASIYASQNRFAKAQEALEKAKSLDPANPRIGEIEKGIKR